jgi:hypothetical protein
MLGPDCLACLEAVQCCLVVNGVDILLVTRGSGQTGNDRSNRPILFRDFFQESKHISWICDGALNDMGAVKVGGKESIICFFSSNNCDCLVALANRFPYDGFANVSGGPKDNSCLLVEESSFFIAISKVVFVL